MGYILCNEKKYSFHPSQNKTGVMSISSVDHRRSKIASTLTLRKGGDPVGGGNMNSVLLANIVRSNVGEIKVVHERNLENITDCFSLSEWMQSR